MTPPERSTVVVTGGTRGLGRELSLEFARAGYAVLSLYQADVRAAESLDEAFAAEGLTGRALRHDVSSGDSAAEVWVQPEITNAASLTLIHNAAAPFEPKPLHLLVWDDFATSLDVALKGGWLCALGMLRPMLKRGGGTIVTVLTTALAPPPPKGFAAYLAAKGALRALTEALAAEYGGRGIRVLSVSPGFMRTSLTDGWHRAFREAALKSAADPTQVAVKIRAIIENADLPCRGENYDV
jgi:NAD(P)-dependent dehydrogenase (short-subunit alcohol dehydrogenase family)